VSNVSISNVLGIKELGFSLENPLTLICGGNATGKTSVRDAIRLAVTGNLARITKRGELKSLLHHGTKKGGVTVTLGDSLFTFLLPSGKGVHSENEFAEFALNNQGFTAASAHERKTALFRLLKVDATPNSVRTMLIERGVSDKIADDILPALRGGFDNAEKQAKEWASESRGAWKAVTNETYGTEKAGAWEAERPSAIVDIDALRDALAVAEAEYDEATRAIGRDESDRRQLERHNRQVADLTEKAACRKRKADQAAAERKTLAIMEDQIAQSESMQGIGKKAEPQACPHCGGAIEIVNGHVVAHTPADRPANYDATIARSLGEYRRQRDSLVRSIESLDQQVAQADAAAAALSTMPEPPGAPTESEVAEHDRRAAEARAIVSATNAEIMQAEANNRAAIDADRRTSEALQHHEDVLAWIRVAELMRAIPQELLAQVLGQFNAKLAESATAARFLVPIVSDDMSINANGTPFDLLSESEQWRVSVMISAAFAELSGLGLLVVDRLDVLEPAARSNALKWLANCGLTVVALATLKEAPKLASATVVWLQT